MQHTAIESIIKPSPIDARHHKERYIQSKYVEKLLVVKDIAESGNISYAKSLWDAVKTNDLREAYRLIAVSAAPIVNTTFDDVLCGRDSDSEESGNSLRGCSLLHLACQNDNHVMLELLLQFGANLNVRDFHGRTPVHQCISKRNNTLTKFLLRRFKQLNKDIS